LQEKFCFVPVYRSFFLGVSAVGQASMSFGDQAVGTVSAPQTFPISNQNSPVLLNISITVNTADFHIGPGTTCPINGILGPSSSCNLNIVFSPNAIGSRSGTATINQLGFASVTIFLSGTGVTAPAPTPTPTPVRAVNWNGINWTNLYPSNFLEINSPSGDLEVLTGDSSVGFFGGAVHAFPTALSGTPEAWTEATFFDTGASPGPQINALFFDTSNSVFLASLGANDTQPNYVAHWRRESPLGAVVRTNTETLIPRSPGEHSVAIGRPSNGSLEFWLDGTIQFTTGAGEFPQNFNFVYLVAKGTSLGQQATFKAYSEGAGPFPSLPRQFGMFTSRTAWEAAVSNPVNITFEGIAPAGEFTFLDTPSGLTLSGVNFEGIAPSNTQLPFYLRVVDPLFGPALYDWGAGAILHGPPVPIGPQGEGGPNSHIHVTLPKGVTSFGADIMSILQYASPFEVTVSTAGGISRFQVKSLPHPNRAFVGFVSAIPIDSVDFSALNGFPILDNFSFAPTPRGSFAYETNFASSNVSAYAIDPLAGTLTAVPGSPFSAGSGAIAVAIDPSGRFAYVANWFGDNVSAYAINSTDGSLTSITGSPFSAGLQPFALTVDPAGVFCTWLTLARITFPCMRLTVPRVFCRQSPALRSR
jgi:lactonase family protein with 7-bladed beta-propeller